MEFFLLKISVEVRETTQVKYPESTQVDRITVFKPNLQIKD